MMDEKKIRFKSVDGLELNGKSWNNPKKTPTAAIFLIHGLGEHSGRYRNFAKFFIENNISVSAFDLRGHGQSSGKRGHTPDYELLLKDIEIFIDNADDLIPKKTPIILYGHSMGGNLVANYLLKKNTSNLFRGIITSAWLKLAIRLSPFKMGLLKTLNNYLPGYSQKTNIKITELTKDYHIVKNYRDDPLVHDNISANLFLEAYESGLWAINNAEKLKTKTLVMHGMQDKITSPLGSIEFARNARPLTTEKIWQNMKHELHNELEKNEVMNFTLNWINTELS